MSTPWWNEKNPGPSKPPDSTPFSNTVRGSPKKPRIGCCLLNGLSGQLYADAAPADASASAAATVATIPTRRMTSEWYGGLRLADLPPEVRHELRHPGVPDAAGQGEGAPGAG